MTAPHTIETEVQARDVVAKAYAFRVSNPEKLAAAYRVIERNTEYRRARTISPLVFVSNDPTEIEYRG